MHQLNRLASRGDTIETIDCDNYTNPTYHTDLPYFFDLAFKIFYFGLLTQQLEILWAAFGVR